MGRAKKLPEQEEPKKTAQAKSPKKETSAEKPAAKAKSAKNPADTAAGKKPAKKAAADTAAEKPKAAKKNAADSVTGKAKAANNPDKSPKPEAPSSKTPQVMKLIAPHGDYVNPVIIAGKASIPKKLRGVEPLSRIMRREAKAVLGEDISGLPEESEEVVTLNLTAAAISENAGLLLRRFNACDCEKCIAALTKMTEEKVPARFVKISKQDAERGSCELDELKEPLKKAVVSQMIRVLLGNKKRSFHEE